MSGPILTKRMLCPYSIPMSAYLYHIHAHTCNCTHTHTHTYTHTQRNNQCLYYRTEKIEHFGKFVTVMDDTCNKMFQKFDDHCNKMSGRKYNYVIQAPPLVIAMFSCSNNEGVAQNVSCGRWTRTMFQHGKCSL